MKKIFISIIMVFLIFTSCDPDNPGGSNNDSIEPLPNGVYIAGWNDIPDISSGACYWTRGRRVDLNGYDPYSVSASGGKVLVKGNFLTPLDDSTDGHVIEINGVKYKSNPCYWVNGIRYEYEFSGDIIISGGKVYIFSFSSDENCYWVDGEKVTIDLPKDFSVRSYAVSGGHVYVVGDNNSFYFMDNMRHDIAPDFHPYNIAVGKDGVVYITGSYYTDGNRKFGHYVNGEFIELQDFDNSYMAIKRIMLSGGKVYMFQFHENCYWVDGEKITYDLPEDSYVQDCAIVGGKLWMVGGYYVEKDQAGEPTKSKACYWIDGERYDLSSIGENYDLKGSMATAIFVEE